MSLEQLIFIIIFILVPVVRAIAERRHKQRRTEESEELFETIARTELPGGPSYDPPAWPAPASPPPAQPRAASLRAPVVAVPSERPPAPEPAPRPLPPAARSLRTARARARAAVPRDREGLRRALLLVEILGPPRALEPRGR